MNKSEFVDYIASQNNCSKVEAEKAISLFTKGITGALSDGNMVALVGFGNFSVSKVPEKTGRNPRTGAAITISARIQPKFSAGKSLKDSCNEDKKVVPSSSKKK